MRLARPGERAAPSTTTGVTNTESRESKHRGPQQKAPLVAFGHCTTRGVRRGGRPPHNILYWCVVEPHSIISSNTHHEVRRCGPLNPVEFYYKLFSVSSNHRRPG